MKQKKVRPWWLAILFIPVELCNWHFWKEFFQKNELAKMSDPKRNFDFSKG